MDKQNTLEVETRIGQLLEEIEVRKQELYKLSREMPRFEVQDYDLLTPDGNAIKLSELFGDKDELILVHNMGRHCPYCTMWADGFNGIFPHLESRAAFVVSTPDAPEVIKSFAESRGWKFRMVSTQPSTLKKDLGFELENKHYMPGVSTFVKDENGVIRHVAKAFFGPGDDFCSVWYFFDLLANQQEEWGPKFSY
jgi:predicted dithiol-disulfide oxidoreductase (DUF899 family)